MGIKYKVNEEFFDTWSPEIAYVLGYFFADGCIIDTASIRGRYISVLSIDKDRIELIRNLLGSEHKIYCRDRGGNHKIAYILRIGSHQLYDRLEKLGISPSKSLTMEFPFIPKQYESYFTLGYFDGDGCVYLASADTERPKHLKTIFTSGSKQFLKSLQEVLLEHAGIEKHGLYPHRSTNNAYQLRYTARDSIRLFLFLYPDEFSISLALARKYGKFMTYFNKLGLNREDFPRILKSKGPVAK